MKTFLLLVLMSVNQVPDQQEKVPQYLQDISVTISAGGSQGSGVLKSRGETTYVWTAAHVVEGLRHVRTVLDPNSGSDRKLVEFDDVVILKELYEEGRSVGKVEMQAEVLRYSDPENGEDLALLRVRKKGFHVKDSVVFSEAKTIPEVGTRLWHCGSLLGQTGSNSITEGLLSQIGRVYQKKVYDQSSCNAFPGSSGGGIFLKNGKYIGMLTRGSGETYNLFVPLRRMRDWATKVGVTFAMDDTVPVPDEKTLISKPIEDAPMILQKATERAVAPKPSNIHYWIYNGE